MELIRGTSEFAVGRPTAVSLGKFDGLHRGHQLLLERILEKKETGLAPLIFTFDFGKRPGLMLPKERRLMLEQKGTDYLLECPFVPEISRLEPEVFVEEILVRRLRTEYLAVGADFRFGYKRRGDYRLLMELGGRLGFRVDVVEKACFEGREISSTFIREELEQGRMERVNALLGYPYSVTGEVVHGLQIGRTLGMPTTNLNPEEEKLLPPNGVYATKTRIDGRNYEGITNIGLKPTVEGERKKGVETYLFGVEQDLYGKEITVEFYTFRRPERKFDSLEELKNQLFRDVEWGRRHFEGKP
ncbi:MAG: bifunctional riboflavin kinase/FAD synthetase [Lachnospiraceae bacterium]|nr:bifunctional riboflavin kinase/FAD synthetase [Lachnospiraceae bacterium]